MAKFHRVDTTQLVRGAARLLYAPMSQTKPMQISDVIDTTTYDAQTGWIDLGATRNGINISVNNTENAFTVDQVAGDIGTAPESWECLVATELAEITLEHLVLAWEGASVTTDTSITPSEKETGFAGATSYTQRRLAIMFQKPSLLITGYFFHMVVRAPQQTTLSFQKGGDAQTIAVQFRALSDSSEADPLMAFFRIREQQA
jgi:hypothetical protein